MKRVRVAPGKFVTISTELSEKAARVFATGLTRDQVRDLKASETLRDAVAWHKRDRAPAANALRG